MSTTENFEDSEEGVTVRVSHHFAAAAERVFDAWMDPSIARKFLFATATGQVVRTEIDGRVGGGFTIVERRRGEDTPRTGTYLELTRPRRIAFTLAVPKFAEDAALIPADTITIDLQPLAGGCELNLTHRRTASAAAETADQAVDRWTGMLDLLSEILSEPPPTCGVGLAQHATVPTRIGLLFRALADTLELHRGTLMLNDPNARAEDYAYQHLASSYRQLAMLVQGTASKMAGYSELPAAAHDPRAFGPDHVKAFARYVKAQSRLLSILKGAAERDEELLEQMSAPPPA